MRASVAITALVASASPALGAPSTPSASPARILYANSAHIYLSSYDGSKFTTTLNSSVPNTDPSWLVFVAPNSLYAVNDIASNTYLYNLDINGNKLKAVTNKQGSGGVVHLEVNKAKTRMLGAGYGSGKVDVWNIENGGLQLIKSIKSDGKLGPNKDRQDAPHPHGSFNDPSGRFFAVNDLGTDTIMLIDSQNDAFNIVNRVPVTPAGAGPRHGVFYPANAAQATHYFVVCEMGNIVNAYALNYTSAGGKGINFTPIQTISTFGPNNPVPNGAGAGELVISPDNKDLYLSNRLTGAATDNIAHLKIQNDGKGNVKLQWINSVSSGGTSPRMFSISTDGSTLFVANQNGANSVATISRNTQDGSIAPGFHGTINSSVFGQNGLGPQYIKQLQ